MTHLCRFEAYSVQFRGRDVRRIERKLLQVATGITTFAAEEEAEFKEVDVATWELKSRHQEQPVQPTAAPGDVAT